MIYFIEGMTCAGKSTMAKNLAAEKGWRFMPEHTPLPPNGQDMAQRQTFIFNDFLSQFEEALTCEDIFIADFSPAGPIPFNRALAEIETNPEVKQTYIALANQFDEIWQKKLNYWGSRVQQLTYLSISGEEALKRLQNRSRLGDNAWSLELLNALSREYDIYFK